MKKKKMNQGALFKKRPNKQSNFLYVVYIVWYTDCKVMPGSIVSNTHLMSWLKARPRKNYINAYWGIKYFLICNFYTSSIFNYCIIIIF